MRHPHSSAHSGSQQPRSLSPLDVVFETTIGSTDYAEIPVESIPVDEIPYEYFDFGPNRISHRSKGVKAKPARMPGGPKPGPAAGEAESTAHTDVMCPIVVNTSPSELVTDGYWRAPGGVDGLHIGVFGEAGLEYEEFLGLLAKAKLQKQSNERWDFVQKRELGTPQNPKPGEVVVFGATMWVRPKGFGDVPGNPCEWVADLQYGTCIGFTKKHSGKGNVACVVELGSLDLMLNGHREAWARVAGVLAGVGLQITRTRVRRVDICTDLAGMSIEPFYDALHEKQTVNRLRTKVQFHWTDDGRAKQGVTIHGQRVLVRLYDKVEELRSRESRGDEMSTMKREVMVERRWGGVPDNAVRIEFQIKGEWLRAFGIETVEQLFDRLNAIAKHMFTKFFRIVDGLTEADRANKNQSKAATSPLWLQVIEATLQWADRAMEELKRESVEPKPVNVVKRVQRYYSAVASLAALVDGAEGMQPVELMELACELALQNPVPDEDMGKFVEKMQQRITDAQIRVRKTGRELLDGYEATRGGERCLVVPVVEFDRWCGRRGSDELEFPPRSESEVLRDASREMALLREIGRRPPVRGSVPLLSKDCLFQ